MTTALSVTIVKAVAPITTGAITAHLCGATRRVRPAERRHGRRGARPADGQTFIGPEGGFTLACNDIAALALRRGEPGSQTARAVHGRRPVDAQRRRANRRIRDVDLPSGPFALAMPTNTAREESGMVGGVADYFSARCIAINRGLVGPDHVAF